MRLIDADKLSEAMYHEAFETDTDMQKWEGGCWIRYKMFENKIEEAPTLEERKTGRWIVITKMDGKTLYECSVCGKRVIFDDLMDLPNYCDHCGAKMEGSDAE